MPRGKPFAKGKSGNPGGRPKIDAAFRDRAKKAVDEVVIDAWIDECRERPREIITPAGPMDMTCRGKEWMRASQLLAEYGYGKPIQAMEHSGPDGAPIQTKVIVEFVDPEKA